jgi:hypothetical protein
MLDDLNQPNLNDPLDESDKEDGDHTDSEAS